MVFLPRWISNGELVALPRRCLRPEIVLQHCGSVRPSYASSRSCSAVGCLCILGAKAIARDGGRESAAAFAKALDVGVHVGVEHQDAKCEEERESRLEHAGGTAREAKTSGPDKRTITRRQPRDR